MPIDLVSNQVLAGEIIIIININAMVKNKEQVNKLESEAGEG